jgi:transposase
MESFYLGGDVSKGYSDFIIIDSQKEIIEADFQLDDNQRGHKKLQEVLNQFFLQNPDSEIFAGVESTGGYENNWYSFLKKLNVEGMRISVARINPKGTNHNNQADMNRVTTDKVSAKNIAEYLINHKKKIEYNKTDLFFHTRKQWKFIRMLVKQKTQLYNQLQSLLYTANPEILRYCKHGYPQWLIKVLKKYPTAKMLSKAKKTALERIPYLSSQKAGALISNAKSSTASSIDETTAKLIKDTLEQIIQMEKVCTQQVEKLSREFPLQEEVKILKSFIGIDDYSAMGLLMNIGTIKNFSESKNISSFFGLHPVYKKSGDGTWGMHLSKQGSSEVRYILYNVAKCAVVNNPLIKEIYQHHLCRGKKKASALGVCMHKIIRIIFGMLKNMEKYNPEKDRAIRERSYSRKNITDYSDKSRRYQPLDNAAPISRRQAKRRNEILIDRSKKKEEPITSQND